MVHQSISNTSINQYFDANGFFGLQALWYIFLSPRSDGKTFNIKYRGLKRFLKTGKKTVYMRRWKTEFTKAMQETFLDDVIKIYPEYQNLKIKSDKSGIKIERNGKYEYAFYFIPLSVSGKLKSSIAPLDIAEIDYDEYIPLDGKYIPEEITLLLEFWNTCDRQRGEVKLCIFGNKIHSNNPLFNFFDVKIDIENPKVKTYKNGQLAVVIYKNEYRQTVMLNNPFMDLIKGTYYEDYMNGGILSIKPSHVQIRPKNASIWSRFKSEIGEGTIYIDEEDFYISEKITEYDTVITDKIYDIKDKQYVCTSGNIPKFFREVYRNGNLYAESVLAWELFTPLIKIMNIR